MEELKKPFLSMNQSAENAWFVTKTYVRMMRQAWQMTDEKH